MKRSRMILVSTALLLSWVAAWTLSVAAPGRTTTTIILVRHAEKQSEPGDPSLSDDGRARAEALARTLADAGVTGLSATPFRRTQQTLEPLAKQTGLEIEVQPVDLSSPDGYARELVASLLANHAGGTVVVAGHSNTLPLLLEALGIAGPRSIGDDEYDDLFVVQVVVGKAPLLLQLHYGARSP